MCDISYTSLSLMFIIIKCIEIIEIYRRCKDNHQIAIVVYSLEWKIKYKKTTGSYNTFKYTLWNPIKKKLQYHITSIIITYYH